MTDAQTDPNSKGRATLSDLVKLIGQISAILGALASIITSIFAIMNSISAYNQSTEAKKLASTAAATASTAASKASIAANTASLQVAEQNPVTQSSTEAVFVQLATYKTISCITAEQEIASYHTAFSPSPQLWRDQTDQYIIIGIVAPDINSGKSLIKTAHDLSLEPAQAGNDLANAFIRKLPSWAPLKNCAGL